MQHTHCTIKTFNYHVFNKCKAQLKILVCVTIKLLNSARYLVRTESPRTLEKIGHSYINDYGKNDFRFQLKRKFLYLIP